MIITCRYELTDLGMNFDSIMKMLEDCIEHLFKEIPTLQGRDDKFIVLMHPELVHKMHQHMPTMTHIAMNYMPDIDIDTFPGRVENVRVMNLGIVSTTILEPNELVITSQEFVPLIERFMKAATKEAFAKGERYGYLHSHPESREYDEGYILVNLNDEESMERFKDRMKWKVKK